MGISQLFRTFEKLMTKSDKSGQQWASSGRSKITYMCLAQVSSLPDTVYNAKKFMRKFDEVLERLKETTGIEEINKVKEYFVDEYPEIFCVEYSFRKTNIEAERISKYNKKITDFEETLLNSISMEPFKNYEGIENDKTLSTVQKIVLYQKAIDDMKRKQIYFAANQAKLLERCFIQGRGIYNKTLKENGASRRWA